MKKQFLFSVTVVLCMFGMNGCFFNPDDGKTCSYEWDDSVEMPNFLDYCMDSEHPTTCLDGIVHTTECLSREICDIDEFGYSGCFLNIGNECEFTECTDEWTLGVCEDGWLKPQECYYGCLWDIGECGGPVCDFNECEGDTLYICDDGLWSDESVDCQHGCLDGACIQPECTESVCANDTQLLACRDGSIVPKNCSFGCSQGKCNPAECSADVCKDETQLLACENGYIVPKNCPFGCSQDKCNPAECEDSVCSDDKQSLVECVNGFKQEIVCDYKCENKQCIADNTARCLDDRRLLVRDASEKYRTIECEFACMNGVCLNETMSWCIDENTEAWGTDEHRIEIACDNGCSGGVCNAVQCSSFKPVCLSENILLNCENEDIAYKTCASDEICFDGECQKKDASSAVCKTNKVLTDNINGVLVETECLGECRDAQCMNGVEACIAFEPESKLCQGYDIHQCDEVFSKVHHCNPFVGEICIENADAENVEIMHAECRTACDPASYRKNIRIEYDSKNEVWNSVSYTCVKDRNDRGYIQSEVLKTNKLGFKADGTPLVDESIVGTECVAEEYETKCLENGFALRCQKDENSEKSAVIIEDCRGALKSCVIKEHKAVCE